MFAENDVGLKGPVGKLSSGVTSVGATAPITSTGGATPNIGINLAGLLPSSISALNNSSATMTLQHNGDWVSGSATISLTAGTWLIFGLAMFGDNGSSPSYAFIYPAAFCTADGADTNSKPTVVSTTGNYTLKTGLPDPAGQVSNSNFPFPTNTANGGCWPMEPIILAVSATSSVYLVPNCNAVTATNAKIKTNIWALKISTATS